MKKSLCATAMIGLFMLPLSLTSCAAVESAAPSVVPIPPNADKVDAKLLESDCRSSTVRDFQSRRLCYQVVAAKLPPLDPSKRDHFGELYDPQKFLECKMKAQNIYELNATGHCDRYRLRRIENPEYWPNADVPKPKLPEAPNPPVYREGMTSEEYFKALCEKEAGEFIYKTVENVDGIYQIRPRSRADDDDQRMQDRYVIEDPYGYVQGDSEEMEYRYSDLMRSYAFFERPYIPAQIPNWKKQNRDPSLFVLPLSLLSYEHFYGYDGKEFKTLKKTYLDKPRAQYGYTWRGIVRPHDRKLGITGGELIVVDLKTGEVLGIRRNFVRSGYTKNFTGFWWLTAQSCLQVTKQQGNRLVKRTNSDFIYSVLKPTPQTQKTN